MVPEHAFSFKSNFNADLHKLRLFLRLGLSVLSTNIFYSSAFRAASKHLMFLLQQTTLLLNMPASEYRCDKTVKAGEQQKFVLHRSLKTFAKSKENFY